MQCFRAEQPKQSFMLPLSHGSEVDWSTVARFFSGARAEIEKSGLLGATSRMCLHRPHEEGNQQSDFERGHENVVHYER